MVLVKTSGSKDLRGLLLADAGPMYEAERLE